MKQKLENMQMRNLKQEKPSGGSGMGRELAAIIAGSLMPSLDTTIVSIGIASLMEAFGVSEAAVQWISTAYLLALAVAIPAVGWAEERFGGRHCWMAGLVIFLVGSGLCAASPGLVTLVMCRVIQGFGAGALITLLTSLPVEIARSRGITAVGGIMSTVMLPLSLGPILGPVLGDIVLSAASWHWLFLINIPVGILHPGAAVPLALGVLLLIVFAALPSSRDPERAIVDIGLFRYRSVSAASAAMFFAGGTLYAAQFLFPLFWQQTIGASALEAALMLLPQGIGALFTRTAAGRLTDAYGGRVVATGGFLACVISMAPFLLMGDQTDSFLLYAFLFVRGLAIGMLIVPITTSAFRGLPDNDVSRATVIIRAFQQVGGSFATAAVAAAVSSSAQGAALYALEKSMR